MDCTVRQVSPYRRTASAAGLVRIQCYLDGDIQVAISDFETVQFGGHRLQMLGADVPAQAIRLIDFETIASPAPARTAIH